MTTTAQTKSGSVTKAQARKIMGKIGYVGVATVIHCFQLKPTSSQLKHLATIPFDDEFLLSCRDTQVLIPFFPISIFDIRKYLEETSCMKLWFPKDFDGKAFILNKGEIGWRLVPRKPTNEWETVNTQLTAQMVVYAMFAHRNGLRWPASNEAIFMGGTVSCSDVDCDGFKVEVGEIGGMGEYDECWTTHLCRNQS